MPTAFLRFVAFTLAHYRPRNALINVIADKRSRYAVAGDYRWPLPESLCPSRRSIPPRISKSQFAERAVVLHRENVSLSFNERLDKGEERNCFFGAAGRNDISFPSRGAKRRERKRGLRFFSKYGLSARQRPKCSYFQLGCWRERLLIFFAK